jgi:2-methylisocitrate lyase-like PEP mutase family enzyme
MAMGEASEGSRPGQSGVSARRTAFRELHRTGCFVIPNPWDIGTARWLRALGFKALATTSAGFAFSRGLPDSGALPRDEVLRHAAEIVEATDLPVNADFQAGYSDSPHGVAESVALCIRTGVAGLSIEDATGDAAHPLRELSEALDRLRAARAAIDASGSGVLLTARAECYLVSHPKPLAESIRRLSAYAEAGADVLYAPGPTARDDIKAIVKAASPKPINVLVSSSTGLTVSDLAALGVRRISVGSALARAAWTGFARAATLIAEQGSFEGFDALVPFSELDRFFAGLR